MQLKSGNSGPSQGTTLTIGHLVQRGQFDGCSGSSVNPVALVRALRSAGHDASLLYLGDKRQVFELGNIQLAPEQRELGLSGRALFRLVEGSIRFAQSELGLPFVGFFDSFRFREACLKHLSHCDIFHERFTMMSLGGSWAARKLSRPLILEVHADIMNAEMPLLGRSLGWCQRLLSKLVTRQCFAHASKILVVSKAVGESLRARWGVPVGKITVLPNAADTDLFRPMPEQAEVKAELGLGNEPVVMFVGSFMPWHGLGLLVDAFCQVTQEIPDARLILVGNGPDRPDLEAQAKQAGLEDKVVFTGHVPQRKVPQFLSLADVAVAPYPKLPGKLWFSPLKLFEYMAAAKAIVASDVGQIGEVVTDGYSGQLVEPGSIQGLADAIVTLLRDKELGSRLGQNARKEALEKHSWKSRVSQLEQIYLSVLATGGE